MEIDEQEDVPDLVKRLREAGFKVTIGTGEPLSYEPEVSFANPPPSKRDADGLVQKLRRSVVLISKRLTRMRRHATLP